MVSNPASGEANFVQLAQELESSYRAYLQATFHFRDLGLRKSFESALQQDHLAKGPFVEAIPAFERIGTLADVAAHHGLPLPTEVVTAAGGDRRLYAHQGEAIRLVEEGRNVVVATGTGSGKTEAFLFPILMHLYREHLTGQIGPGVRALILYPMNALANDQRDRLRAIDRELVRAGSQFRFMFGQYTGETPADESDTSRQALQKAQEASPSELVFRQQMRATPPHILLTNYSMLEYLLLRPDDSPLFDDGQGANWAFIVLDEAHQYRGANGIEMGMLMRRLKQRIRQGGRTGSIRCIATSATIGAGVASRVGVARFASDLFGEPFDETDVVIPAPREVALTPQRTFDASEYSRLARELDEGTIDQRALGSRLARDDRAVAVIRKVRTTPQLLRDLGTATFPELHEQSAHAAISTLLRLLNAGHDEQGEPLLSARVHLFLRAMEGAFLAFQPEPHIVLNRGASASKTFEVALCRECGQHYITGRRSGSELVEAKRDPSDPDFGVTFWLPSPASASDEFDEDLLREGDTSRTGRRIALCGDCGSVRDSLSASSCAHDADVTLTEVDAGRQPSQARRCINCGYKGQDPIAEVVHGADGPHAVIATTLFHRLPSERRKILAFADGRQQAAFFAWYLDRSYRDLFARNQIFHTVEESTSRDVASSLNELARALEARMLETGILRESDAPTTRRQRAWRDVYREFATDQRRIALDGLGLIGWRIDWPKQFRPPTSLGASPLQLSHETALEVVQALLETLRMRSAVELVTEPGVHLTWDDLELTTSQVSARIGKPMGSQRHLAWDGPGTHRADLVRRLLKRISGGPVADEQIANLLREIWQHIADFDDAQASDHGLLSDLRDGSRRLNPIWWRAFIPKKLYRCSVCDHIQPMFLQGVCLRFACPGLVTEVTAPLDANHYRTLASISLPGRLRVEEHTAQLSSDIARQYQHDFKENRIHVLSCSTTFELGVDLGDLDTVFLRNVPPESFNYAQRVGRAGRRQGFPGFAVTYCGRTSHDLFNFADPMRIMAGRITPPNLRLANEKIAARHISAVILSDFFRRHPQRFKGTDGLLGDMADPNVVQALEVHCNERARELDSTLSTIVPPEMHAQFGIGARRPSWIERCAGPGSRFASAISELASEYVQIERFESQSATEKRYDDAKWASMRARTLAGAEVIGFLSRKAVVPKYGFPVDVVDLDVRLAEERAAIELDRDLSIAIAEFAPGASVVANKRLWTSYAVKRVPDKEWDRSSYSVCRVHGVFHPWRTEEERRALTPCCDKLRDGAPQYVIPEFGFTTGRIERPKEPKRRPNRQYSTRPYVESTSALPPQQEIPASRPLLRVFQPSPSTMVVLCEGQHGRGFNICFECGTNVRSTSKNGSSKAHRTPFNRACTGQARRVTLAHRFSTDAIRLQFLERAASAAHEGFAWSLAYALVEGAASVTGAPTSDLSVTVTHTDTSALPHIVLYDSVPGGAGLVATLHDPDQLRRALEEALVRVNGACGCGHDDSCYGCLRSYRNQFVHTQLRRGPTKEYLEHVLARWAQVELGA